MSNGPASSLAERLISYLDSTTDPAGREIKVVAGMLGETLMDVSQEAARLEHAGEIIVDRRAGPMVLRTPRTPS